MDTKSIKKAYGIGLLFAQSDAPVVSFDDEFDYNVDEYAHNNQYVEEIYEHEELSEISEQQEIINSCIEYFNNGSVRVSNIAKDLLGENLNDKIVVAILLKSCLEGLKEHEIYADTELVDESLKSFKTSLGNAIDEIKQTSPDYNEVIDEISKMYQMSEDDYGAFLDTLMNSSIEYRHINTMFFINEMTKAIEYITSKDDNEYQFDPITNHDLELFFDEFQLSQPMNKKVNEEFISKFNEASKRYNIDLSINASNGDEFMFSLTDRQRKKHISGFRV